MSNTVFYKKVMGYNIEVHFDKNFKGYFVKVDDRTFPLTYVVTDASLEDIFLNVCYELGVINAKS